MRKPAAQLVVAAVAVPVAVKVLRRVGRSIQARRGSSPTTDAMRRAASGVDAYSGQGYGAYSG
jgi:hypothetical protein